MVKTKPKKRCGCPACVDVREKFMVKEITHTGESKRGAIEPLVIELAEAMNRHGVKSIKIEERNNA